MLGYIRVQGWLHGPVQEACRTDAAKAMRQHEEQLLVSHREWGVLSLRGLRMGGSGFDETRPISSRQLSRHASAWIQVPAPLGKQQEV